MSSDYASQNSTSVVLEVECLTENAVRDSYLATRIFNIGNMEFKLELRPQWDNNHNQCCFVHFYRLRSGADEDVTIAYSMLLRNQIKRRRQDIYLIGDANQQFRVKSVDLVECELIYILSDVLTNNLTDANNNNGLISNGTIQFKVEMCMLECSNAKEISTWTNSPRFRACLTPAADDMEELTYDFYIVADDERIPVL